MSEHPVGRAKHGFRAKTRLHGLKLPLKRQEIWAIPVHLQRAKRPGDPALVNPAMDSKLRGCDLVRRPICHGARGGRVGSRTTIFPSKTRRPTPCEMKAAGAGCRRTLDRETTSSYFRAACGGRRICRPGITPGW